MNEAVMMQDCQLRPQPGPLAGRHIVVTRPAGQARQLADAIFREGGSAVLFPVLAIRDIDDPAGLADIASRLDSFDLAIFISPNAVSKALKSIRTLGSYTRFQLMSVVRTVASNVSVVRRTFGWEALPVGDPGSGVSPGRSTWRRAPVAALTVKGVGVT